MSRVTGNRNAWWNGMIIWTVNIFYAGTYIPMGCCRVLCFVKTLNVLYCTFTVFANSPRFGQIEQYYVVHVTFSVLLSGTNSQQHITDSFLFGDWARHSLSHTLSSSLSLCVSHWLIDILIDYIYLRHIYIDIDISKITNKQKKALHYIKLICLKRSRKKYTTYLLLPLFLSQ